MKRKLLSVLLVLAMALTLLPTAAFAEETAPLSGEVLGTIEAISEGGKVTTNGQTTTVTFDTGSKLYYAGADASAGTGRNEGYHVGVRVKEPTGKTDSVKYQKVAEWWYDNGTNTINDEGSATNPKWTSVEYATAHTGDKDGEITLWGLVKPEYFGKFGDTTTNTLYFRYRFDWNGDNTWDQEILVKVLPTAGLYAGEEQVWPVENPTISVSAAPQVDTAATPQTNLSKEYSVSTSGETVTVTAKEIKEHENGQHTKGYWIGATFTPIKASNDKTEYVILYKTGDKWVIDTDSCTDGSIVSLYIDAYKNGALNTTGGTITVGVFAKSDVENGEAKSSATVKVQKIYKVIAGTNCSKYTEVKPPEDVTLTVAAVAGDTKLLGKTAADLQKDISVDGLKVSGTSNYVTEYTGWSSVDTDQEGNYIALKLTTDSEEDITVKMTDGNKTVTLDKDGILVWKLSTTTDETTKKTTVNPIKVTVGTTEFTIDLNGVTMEAKTVIKPSVDADGKATATVDTGKTNEAIEAAKSNTEEKDKVVTIDASEPSGSTVVKSAEISIPANTVAAIKDAAIPVAIETPVGSVTLPTEAVAEVAKETATASKPAVLVIEPKDDAVELPEASKDAVVAPYDVSVKVNGNPVELKNLTKAIELTLPVPAELKANKADIVVVYVETAADGNKTYTIVNSTVDEAGNNVTATTKHLSVYAIMLRSTAVALGAKEETPAGLTLKFAEDKNAIGPKVTAEGLTANGVVTVQVCRTAGVAPAAIFTMTATNDGKVTFNVNSGNVVTVWNGAVTFENGAPKNPPVSVTETATVSSKG